MYWNDKENMYEVQSVCYWYFQYLVVGLNVSFMIVVLEEQEAERHCTKVCKSTHGHNQSWQLVFMEY
jgi:hypothetical protein